MLNACQSYFLERFFGLSADLPAFLGTAFFFEAFDALDFVTILLAGFAAGFDLGAGFAAVPSFFSDEDFRSAGGTAGAAGTGSSTRGTASPLSMAAIRGERVFGLDAVAISSWRKNARASLAVLQILACPEVIKTGPLISAGCSTIAVQKSWSVIKRSSSWRARNSGS